MIELGQKAKDMVTGFKGVLTGRCEYLYGCNQYCIVPEIGKDGKIIDGAWFDEGRIQVLGKGILASAVQALKPGGPQRDAPK